MRDTETTLWYPWGAAFAGGSLSFKVEEIVSTVFDVLAQSEFQSGRNRTVFCVLVVKLTTTKHFGILGLTRITKKNVRPHTSCMGGGGRRAPPPAARENHVIR